MSDIIHKTQKVPSKSSLIFQRETKYLTDEELMLYARKNENDALLEELKGCEKYLAEEIVAVMIMHHLMTTYTMSIPKFNPKIVTKIIFEFLPHNSPIFFYDHVFIYDMVISKVLFYIKSLITACDCDLTLVFKTYYQFCDIYLINALKQIKTNKKIKLEFDFKPNIGITHFSWPQFNVFNGFRNLEVVTIISNFKEGNEFCQYLVSCIPNDKNFKLNFVFNGYLNEEEWVGVKNIINRIKNKNIQLGINCWGEDGAFLTYIPETFDENILNKIYRLDVNGDSFDVLKMLRSVLGKMKNLKILICNFHVVEHILKLIRKDKFYKIDALSHSNALRRLQNLRTVSCSFKYVYGLKEEQYVHLDIINFAFNNFIELLPNTIENFHIHGLKNLDLKLITKIRIFFPELVFISLSRILNVDRGCLESLPKLKYIVLHDCDPIIVPQKITACGCVYCPHNDFTDHENRSDIYWKCKECKKKYFLWRNEIMGRKKFRNQVLHTTSYGINIFFNDKQDAKKILDIYDEDFHSDLYQGVFYRRIFEY
uniref:Leucine-rich repeat containing protein n=1 Tax=Parastrongyloides trichosuri TaxID=131310 RepID=A0A0N4Z446_PARTI